jgi:hypothetical protein
VTLVGGELYFSENSGVSFFLDKAFICFAIFLTLERRDSEIFESDEMSHLFSLHKFDFYK